MSKANPHLRAYAALTLIMVFWAGNAIVGRAVHNDIPPFFLSFARWTGGFLVLLPFAARKLAADRAVLARNWVKLVAFGVVGVATFNAFLYWGLGYTTATNGLLMQALMPGLVLAFGFVLFRDRAPLGQVLGVVLSTMGVGVIIFQADLAALLRLRFGFGDGLVLCGCLAWSLYTAVLRLRPPVHPWSFLTVTFAVASLALTPLVASEWREIAAMRWGPGVFAAIAYVAVLPSVVSYFLYNWAVAEVGAGPAGQTMSLMPLFGAVLAALLLHEPFHAYHLAGMALICGGIVLTAVTLARRRPAVVQPLGKS